MDFEALKGFLGALADAAADRTLPRFRSGLAVDNKHASGFDPVTAADRDAEAAMRDLIHARFPGHGIVGEEHGDEQGGAEFVWVLDPIDGTRSFIAGIPLWGTLIGLLQRGRPVLGMMAQPFTRERFAGDGRSAWYEGPGGARPLRVRGCAGLSEAVLFTTSPHLFAAGEAPRFQAVEGRVRLSRYGADCYAYSMLAAGHVDLVIEAGLKPYDIVALIPLIEGAGGRVTAWDGGPAAAGGRIVAAGDPRVHEQAMKLLAG
jgi:myo-inositol-1(or 4)-monophosphatase